MRKWSFPYVTFHLNIETVIYIYYCAYNIYKWIYIHNIHIEKSEIVVFNVINCITHDLIELQNNI